jgi:hypothetical protein
VSLASGLHRSASEEGRRRRSHRQTARKRKDNSGPVCGERKAFAALDSHGVMSSGYFILNPFLRLSISKVIESVIV